MTATPTFDLRAKRSWRTTKNTLMLGLMAGAVVLVAIPLFAVLWSVISRGAAVAFHGFPDFFTHEIPVVSRRPGPGMGPAILGTLLSTGGATLIAVPLGILGAIYLHEYGGTGWFARLVRFMSTVMTGVPSVVMGLFVYLIWTMTPSLSLFDREPHLHGYSAFGGALALACLMLPVVIGSCEQMLRLVPAQLREAAYALGTTKSRTIVTVVLPAALPGLVSGSLLAVARAAGETAPLLFAVGAATAYNPHLFSEANTALSVQIFANANSSFAAAQDRAWAAALTLVMLTFIVTLVARWFTARLALKR
ncbi:MAG: phosphate ABC transporter permease PstA [Kofleriaceae bacterium]